WARLGRTVEFVRVRTYGTEAEVARVGRRVRKLHSKLTGIDMRPGETFPIAEPENRLWVHMGEVDSHLDVPRRPSAALTGADADMREYYEEMRRRIWACREAREGLRRMFNPAVPRHLLPLKLAAPALGTLVVATLPRWARRVYGLPGLPTSDLAATLTLKGL